jgi:hypothetical protein
MFPAAVKFLKFGKMHPALSLVLFKPLLLCSRSTSLRVDHSRNVAAFARKKKNFFVAGCSSTIKLLLRRTFNRFVILLSNFLFCFG